MPSARQGTVGALQAEVPRPGATFRGCEAGVAEPRAAVEKATEGDREGPVPPRHTYHEGRRAARKGVLRELHGGAPPPSSTRGPPGSPSAHSQLREVVADRTTPLGAGPRGSASTGGPPLPGWRPASALWGGVG